MFPKPWSQGSRPSVLFPKHSRLLEATGYCGQDTRLGGGGGSGTELNPFLGWELGADFSSHLLMLALH